MTHGRSEELHEIREAAMRRINTMVGLIAGDVEIAVSADAELRQLFASLEMANPYQPARRRIRKILQPLTDAANPRG